MHVDKLFTRSYISILLANFLLYFGFWILIPILPFYLKENFNVTDGMMGIILSCYTVSALMVRPFSGFLLDSLPRKPLYILSYFIFTSLFCGYILGGTLTLFIILRAAHGLVFGTVTVGGNTVVVDIMPSSRRGEGLGYYGLANNIAMSTGPMVGLFLHGLISFNWIFFCGLSACFVGLIMAMCVKVPRKDKVSQPVTSERKAISLDRFFLKNGLPASLALMLLSIPYGATTNFVAVYVKQINLNIQPGFFFTLLATGMGVSRLFSGKFVDKGYITGCIHFGFYPVIAAFFCLASCKFLLPEHPDWCRVLFLIVPLLQGVGFGTMFPAYNSLYINLAPNNRRATATSTYLTSWDVGIGVGIILSGIIAQYFSYSIVYLIGGFLCILSMLYFNLRVTPHFKQYKLR